MPVLKLGSDAQNWSDGGRKNWRVVVP
jgi:hypothetical protein